MRPETALNGLLIISAKLARVLVWTIFAVIHLFLVVAFLLILWWFQVSPTDAESWISAHASVATAFSPIVAFMGLSGLACLWGYARFWRWVLHKMLEAFLFAE